MTITINPELSSPARLTGAESLDVVDAVDVIDLLDLFWPEAMELDLTQTTRVSAAAVKVLASGIRRAREGGQAIDIVHAQPLVKLFLTITGLQDVEGDELADGPLVEDANRATVRPPHRLLPRGTSRAGAGPCPVAARGAGGGICPLPATLELPLYVLSSLHGGPTTGDSSARSRCPSA